MFDPSRLARMVTLALASCAVTWAFAGSALAMPAPPRPDTGGAAPAYDPYVADSNKAPVAQAPAYKPSPGDTAKAPQPAQVQRVLNGLGHGKTGAPVANPNDDTGTIALITAIVAMLTALGAVALTVMRTQQPVLRA